MDSINEVGCTSVITGKVHSFIVEKTRQERIECTTHEEVTVAGQAGQRGGIYFTRFELSDGTVQEQLGYYNNVNTGDPAWRYHCPGDGGHDKWIMFYPTEEILASLSCEVCEF